MADGLTPPTSGTVSFNPKDTSPNTAHFYAGKLKGVNAAYADGHVEQHNTLQMQCGHTPITTPGVNYWFY